LGQSAEPRLHYTFITRIRNLHSRNISEFDALLVQMFNRELDLPFQKIERGAAP
jgi:hypothetical protein